MIITQLLYIVTTNYLELKHLFIRPIMHAIRHKNDNCEESQSAYTTLYI